MGTMLRPVAIDARLGMIRCGDRATHVEPAAARIFQALVNRTLQDGSWASRRDLLGDVYGSDPDHWPTENTISVQLHLVRRALSSGQVPLIVQGRKGAIGGMRVVRP